MRRLALAFLCLLVVASPALGDDVTKKHQVDRQIGSLQGRLAAQKERERQVRGDLAGYTSRIRSLEARVGDVSLKLQTLEADLSLHQKRLDALNELYALQTRKYRFLKQQYATSVATLNHRLVDIYESDQASSLDVFLGARNLQEAIDQVQYLNEIGEQDRRFAAEVARAKADVTAQRAKTKKVRSTVQGETKVISARTAQTRDVRDELVGARNDLSGIKQQKLTDLSDLNAQQRAEAEEIDALQAVSAQIAARIRAAQARSSGTTSSVSSSGMIGPVSGPVTSSFGWRWAACTRESTTASPTAPRSMPRPQAR
jgi:septal ring factor EnvC (AmiA/AmiB activator)